MMSHGSKGRRTFFNVNFTCCQTRMHFEGLGAQPAKVYMLWVDICNAGSFRILLLVLLLTWKEELTWKAEEER
jgi:hypothetical protein